MRVRVPFGRTSAIGVVVEVAPASTVDARRLKRVREVIDAEPLLDAATLKLLLWSSGYFQHPVGEVVVGTLPRLLRLGRAPKAERSMRYAASAAGAHAFSEGIRGAPVQARLLGFMLDAGSVPEAALAAAHRDWRRPLRVLIGKGWVEAVPDVPAPANRADRWHPAGRTDPSHPADRADPPPPTDPSHPANRADPPPPTDPSHPADRADPPPPIDRADPPQSATRPTRRIPLTVLARRTRPIAPTRRLRSTVPTRHSRPTRPTRRIPLTVLARRTRPIAPTHRAGPA